MSSSHFVQSYFDAWNHRDPVAVADHLADDGTFCDVPRQTLHSHDELIIDLEQFFSRYRHRYELIGDVLEGPNTIAFQYLMFPPALTKKGRSGDTVCGAEFFSLRGDIAMTIHDYYRAPEGARPADALDLMRQGAQPAKYLKSGLNEKQVATYKERLLQIMQAEQVYLQPDLTLHKLAQVVDCSVNHLSQVLNAGFGKSFFDFLSQYRVEHAKGLLSGVHARSSAVLNVAFAVGFSSNSAFYSAFKKHVGQTPARYRQALSR